jgi:hypothetical protein
VHVRSAFPEWVERSAFVPVVPSAGFPFSVAWRDAPRSAVLDVVLRVVQGSLAQRY